MMAIICGFSTRCCAFIRIYLRWNCAQGNTFQQRDWNVCLYICILFPFCSCLLCFLWECLSMPYVMLYCMYNYKWWFLGNPWPSNFWGTTRLIMPCHPLWQALQNLFFNIWRAVAIFVADIQEASLPVNPVSWQEMSRQCDLLLDMTWNKTSVSYDTS